MPIDPIKIPQNVHIEDRIVGPLTLKQILIVGIGCGFSYAMYSLIVKSYGAVGIPITVMAWIPGVLSAAFAFIKINDVSMFRIILLMVERINKPALRTMSPRRGISINIRTFSQNEKKTPGTSDARVKNFDQIDELSSILDLSMPSMIPASATGEKEILSPLAEPIEEEENATVRPVDPSRIQTDTSKNSSQGSISVFRDISPA